MARHRDISHRSTAIGTLEAIFVFCGCILWMHVVDSAAGHLQMQVTYTEELASPKPFCLTFPLKRFNI